MTTVRKCITNSNLPFNMTEKINPTTSIMDNDGSRIGWHDQALVNHGY
jgi:hypothetical protein